MRRGVRNSIVTAGVAAAILLGGTVAANAATATTYIDNWYQGNVGSWRTSTGASQGINLQGCSVNGGNQPSSVQMQLQRNNGPIPISEGNKQQGCYSTMSWGVLVSGAQYRYQYNGHVFNGTWYTGPFSANPVYIYY